MPIDFNFLDMPEIDGTEIGGVSVNVVFNDNFRPMIHICVDEQKYVLPVEVARHLAQMVITVCEYAKSDVLLATFLSASLPRAEIHAVLESLHDHRVRELEAMESGEPLVFSDTIQ